MARLGRFAGEKGQAQGLPLRGREGLGDWRWLEWVDSSRLCGEKGQAQGLPLRGRGGLGDWRWLEWVDSSRLSGGKGQAQGLPLRGREGLGDWRWLEWVDSSRLWGGKGRHKACPYGGVRAGTGRWFGRSIWPRCPGIGGYWAGTRPAPTGARGCEHRSLAQQLVLSTKVGHTKGGVAGGIPPHKGGPKARPHGTAVFSYWFLVFSCEWSVVRGGGACPARDCTWL